MDATTNFNLDDVRGKIAAKSPVSLWDFIPGHGKFISLNRLALRLFEVPYATVGHDILEIWRRETPGAHPRSRLSNAGDAQGNLESSGPLR